MIAYISGPMTGIEDFNRPAFDEKEFELKEHGYTVINPARHPDGLSWQQYMQYAKLDVQNCDVVYQLPGWDKSRGAKLEYEWANEQGKKVMS